MREEHRRLHELAEHLGIGARFTREHDRIVIEFSNWNDCATFRLNAFGNEKEHERFVHTEHFPGDNATWRDAWISAATNELNRMGVAFRVERRGDSARFSFDQTVHHAVFVEMRDQGVFQSRADELEARALTNA